MLYTRSTGWLHWKSFTLEREKEQKMIGGVVQFLVCSFTYFRLIGMLFDRSTEV